MAWAGERHAAVAQELTEWWEDVAEGGIGSQVVLLAVPPGWGRSALLDDLAETASGDDAPVTLVARVTGQPGTRAVQAAAVTDELTEAWRLPRVASLLDLGGAAGRVQLGLGVAGLFVPGGMAVQVAVLLVSLGVTAAGNLWDAGPAGEQGAVAQAARRTARLSLSVPVVVLIDDADCLDPALALTLVRGLAGRADGQVLVVAAAAPGSDLAAALTRDPGPDLAGRVHRADADPAMGYADRVGLAAGLLPGLPPAAAERIARRTATFDEVRAVAATGRVTELAPDTPAAEAAAAADAAADAVLDRGRPAALAIALAWAGGALHARQARRVAEVLGGTRTPGSPDRGRPGALGPPGNDGTHAHGGAGAGGSRGNDGTRTHGGAGAHGGAGGGGLVGDGGAGARDVWGGDPRVVWGGQVVRLAGPADAQVRLQVGALSADDRGRLAAAVLAEAAGLAADAGAGIIERVIARQAVHHVRGDLADPTGLAAVQAALVRGLEALGDPGAARDVAAAALAELDARPAAAGDEAARQQLCTAVLRLAQAAGSPDGDAEPAVREAVDLALSGGAAVGLEARLWAAVDLLRRPASRQAGLALAREVTGSLETRQVTGGLEVRPVPGELASRWRLTLAFHAGRAGDAALAQRLLAPLIRTGPTAGQDAAAAVLRASADPRADTRLQVILLQAELDATADADDEELLRLHQALAADHDRLGEYRQAAEHGRRDVALRRRLSGDSHAATLAARARLAHWTGLAGDRAAALDQARGLLTDQARLLGPEHRATLRTRGDVARWTAESGDLPGALGLSRTLVPDQVRILGPVHATTMTGRANLAYLTGACGNLAGAVQMYRELLADRIQVLGPDHIDTLGTRGNLARWTGEGGDVAQALRLYRELLPDQLRVLGPAHPDTLLTRHNLAALTAESGDPAGALDLCRELLPDKIAILGPDHPETLTTRANIAIYTGEGGDPVAALRLCRELLPDLVRVLGPDHPDALSFRGSTARWTAESGDPARALTLYRDLLPDLVRVLGPDHSGTAITRGHIADLEAAGK